MVRDQTTAQSPPVAAQARVYSLPAWAAALLVGVLALLPRVWGLADFFTLDEANSWVKRVDRFSDALSARDWAATVITGHPGVTVMWLGTLGRWAGRLAGIGDPGWGGGASYLALLRLPVALVNSLAVLAGYLLLRRLLRPAEALLAGILWATSPFLVAHARLLHLDALVTSFITLSLLLLLRATNDQRPMTNDQRRALVGSGIFCGLALLTKAPSLVWLPLAGMIMFLAAWRHWLADLRARHLRAISARFAGLVARYLVWLGCAALVVVLLWPALWVAPLRTLGIVVNEVVANGGQPHALGNYFASQPVADPGALFYPAVILWRTTPVTLVGLLLIIGYTLYDLQFIIERIGFTTRRENVRGSIPNLQSPIFNIQSPVSNLQFPVSNLQFPVSNLQSPVPIRQSPVCNLQFPVFALALFVLLFTLLMSFEPKKFDRYLLPAWPALEILAAVGWVRMYDWLRRQRSRADRRPPTADQRANTTTADQRANTRFAPTRLPARAGVACVVLLTLFLAGTLAVYQPYYIAYFNPLLGGSAIGQRVMLVGWGEGQEYVGAWLRQRPDIKKSAVYTWDPAALGPFVTASTELRDLRDDNPRGHSGYAVLYVRNVQRRDDAQATDYIRQTAPLYTLRLYGVEYATVHQLPFAYKSPLDATFGGTLHLRGFSQRATKDTLTITPAWDVRADQPGGTFCFVHVLDASGRIVAQLDQPLDAGQYPQWQAGQQFGDPLKIAIGQLPAGSYRVILGVYNPATGARLPLTRGQAAHAAADGTDTIALMTLTRPQ